MPVFFLLFPGGAESRLLIKDIFSDKVQSFVGSHVLYCHWNLQCSARDFFVFECHGWYSGSTASSIKGSVGSVGLQSP